MLYEKGTLSPTKKEIRSTSYFLLYSFLSIQSSRSSTNLESRLGTGAFCSCLNLSLNISTERRLDVHDNRRCIMLPFEGFTCSTDDPVYSRRAPKHLSFRTSLEVVCRRTSWLCKGARPALNAASRTSLNACIVVTRTCLFKC